LSPISLLTQQNKKAEQIFYVTHQHIDVRTYGMVLRNRKILVDDIGFVATSEITNSRNNFKEGQIYNSVLLRLYIFNIIIVFLVLFGC